MEGRKCLIPMLLIGLLFTSVAGAAGVEPCGPGSTKTGKKYNVIGSDINVRKGPGTQYSKIINKKASEILRKTHYITIDSSVTVSEECTQGEWSKIRVIQPDWLRKSHQGWVASKYKNIYGSMKSVRRFFNSLDDTTKSNMCGLLQIDGKDADIKHFVNSLYNMRSQFVHNAIFVLHAGKHTSLGTLNNKKIISKFSLSKFSEIFEKGLLIFFGHKL